MTSTRCGWSPKGRAIVSSCSCPPAETGMRPHSTDGASQPLRLVLGRTPEASPCSVCVVRSCASSVQGPQPSLARKIHPVIIPGLGGWMNRCVARGPPRVAVASVPSSSLLQQEPHASNADAAPSRRLTQPRCSAATQRPASGSRHCASDFCMKTHKLSGTEIYGIVTESYKAVFLLCLFSVSPL